MFGRLELLHDSFIKALSSSCAASSRPGIDDRLDPDQRLYLRIQPVRLRVSKFDNRDVTLVVPFHFEKNVQRMWPNAKNKHFGRHWLRHN